MQWTVLPAKEDAVPVCGDGRLYAVHGRRRHLETQLLHSVLPDEDEEDDEDDPPDQVGHDVDGDALVLVPYLEGVGLVHLDAVAVLWRLCWWHLGCGRVHHHGLNRGGGVHDQPDCGGQIIDHFTTVLEKVIHYFTTLS